MSYSGRLTVAVVLAVFAAEATAAWGNDLKAPWSGLLIAASAGALVAVGFVAGLKGMFLAVATVVVSVLGLYLVTDDGAAASSLESCDPGCVSPGGVLLLAVLVVASLTALGATLRALTRLIGLSRHRRGDVAPRARN